MRQKAIVILYSPREILEFLWYYCTYGKEYEWTAICAPYGDMAETQIDTCNSLGIFEEVIYDERNFMEMNMSKKIILFLKMTFYYITGRRKKMCRKIIEGCIGNRNYQLAVIPCDVGILPGAFLAEGKSKKIVILEDGVVDYIERYKWVRWDKIKCVEDFVGFLFAKMGYANTSFCYELKDTQCCEKFAVTPENLKYRNYKNIYRLNDMTNPKFDEKLYTTLRIKVTEKNTVEIEGDIVLFTTQFKGFFENHEIVIHKTIEFINANYSGKKLLLKKHPRDDGCYVFDRSIEVVEIESGLPAEILKDILKVKKYVFMSPSTVILSYKEHMKNMLVLCFEQCVTKSKCKYDYKQFFENGISICHVEEDNIWRV